MDKKKYYEAEYDKLQEDFWERPPSRAIASSPNSDAGINNTKDARSTERRQSKNKIPTPAHRGGRENIAVTAPSLFCCPDAIKWLRDPPIRRIKNTTVDGQGALKGSTQQRRHKVTDKILDGEQKKSYLQSQNPYVTPSSPDFSTVRARQRRKCKDVARQKRRLDGDSTYLESRAVSQPISSRLRSSTGLHGKGTL